MYHIENDKRSQASAELIFNGYSKLIDKTGIESLTITSIADVSGVGRSTFYRLFDNKNDILLYKLDMSFSEIYHRIHPIIQGKHPTEEKLLTMFFEFWLQRKPLLQLLIKTNLFDQLQLRFLTFFCNSLSFVKDMLQLNDREWDYFTHLRASMLSTALKVAIQSYPEDTAMNISHTLFDLFGSKLLVRH